MGDYLEIAFAGEDETGSPAVILHGSREAVKAAARLFGEPVALVPTEGPEFDAMVDRAARAADRALDEAALSRGIDLPTWDETSAQYRANAIIAARAAIRAALAPTGAASEDPRHAD